MLWFRLHIPLVKELSARSALLSRPLSTEALNFRGSTPKPTENISIVPLQLWTSSRSTFEWGLQWKFYCIQNHVENMRLQWKMYKGFLLVDLEPMWTISRMRTIPPTFFENRYPSNVQLKPIFEQDMKSSLNDPCNIPLQIQQRGRNRFCIGGSKIYNTAA